MKAVSLLIVGIVVVVVSGCATTGQPMMSASDWFNRGHTERGGTCVDPDQR